MITCLWKLLFESVPDNQHDEDGMHELVIYFNGFAPICGGSACDKLQATTID
jgi:hypothetical protein